MGVLQHELRQLVVPGGLVLDAPAVLHAKAGFMAQSAFEAMTESLYQCADVNEIDEHILESMSAEHPEDHLKTAGVLTTAPAPLCARLSKAWMHGSMMPSGSGRVAWNA